MNRLSQHSPFFSKFLGFATLPLLGACYGQALDIDAIELLAAQQPDYSETTPSASTAAAAMSSSVAVPAMSSHGVPAASTAAPLVGCLCDADCPEGWLCYGLDPNLPPEQQSTRMTSCVAPEQRCMTDRDCSAEQWCDSEVSECRHIPAMNPTPPNMCGSNSDCAADELCDSSTHLCQPKLTPMHRG
jgi:hypothetical protein